MQNPDGAAAQRQQRDQALAAATQRDTAESLVLLREAVLRLTQQAVCESPTSAPTSRLTKLGPEDDVEAYLGVFEKTGELAGGQVGPHPVPLPHRTHRAGKPGPGAGACQSVPGVETCDIGILWT